MMQHQRQQSMPAYHVIHVVVLSVLSFSPAHILCLQFSRVNE
jgi:hypothetical protein